MRNNKLISEKIMLTDLRARLETALYIIEISNCPQGLLCPGHPTHNLHEYADTIEEHCQQYAASYGAGVVLK